MRTAPEMRTPCLATHDVLASNWKSTKCGPQNGDTTLGTPTSDMIQSNGQLSEFVNFKTIPLFPSWALDRNDCT